MTDNIQRSNGGTKRSQLHIALRSSNRFPPSQHSTPLPTVTPPANAIPCELPHLPIPPHLTSDHHQRLVSPNPRTPTSVATQHRWPNEAHQAQADDPVRRCGWCRSLWPPLHHRGPRRWAMAEAEELMRVYPYLQVPPRPTSDRRQPLVSPLPRAPGSSATQYRWPNGAHQAEDRARHCGWCRSRRPVVALHCHDLQRWAMRVPEEPLGVPFLWQCYHHPKDVFRQACRTRIVHGREGDRCSYERLQLMSQDDVGC